MHDRICPAGRIPGQRQLASDLLRSAPEAANAPEDHTAAFVAAQDGVGTRPGSHRAPRRGVFYPSEKGLANWASTLHSSGKQSIPPTLSAGTFSGHGYAEPSRIEQVAGGIGIVLLVLAPLILLAGGWPLSLLFGGQS